MLQSLALQKGPTLQIDFNKPLSLEAAAQIALAQARTGTTCRFFAADKTWAVRTHALADKLTGAVIVTYYSGRLPANVLRALRSMGTVKEIPYPLLAPANHEYRIAPPE